MAIYDEYTSKMLTLFNTCSYLSLHQRLHLQIGVWSFQVGQAPDRSQYSIESIIANLSTQINSQFKVSPKPDFDWCENFLHFACLS